MDECDEAEDKTSARRDDRAMDRDLAQQEHDKLKKLIARHQKLLRSKQKLFSDAKAASTTNVSACITSCDSTSTCGSTSSVKPSLMLNRVTVRC